MLMLFWGLQLHSGVLAGLMGLRSSDRLSSFHWRVPTMLCTGLLTDVVTHVLLRLLMLSLIFLLLRLLLRNMALLFPRLLLFLAIILSMGLLRLLCHIRLVGDWLFGRGSRHFRHDDLNFLHRRRLLIRSCLVAQRGRFESLHRVF